MQQFKIIGVPFESGCDREGAGKAPEWLLRRGACGMTSTTPLWVDLHLPNDEHPQQGVKNYNTVLQTCLALRDVVSHEYTDGQRLCVIGGDHSIALGSIAGVLEHDANVGVIWFDAHGDINTEATSPSANAHGMPVAALMGLCQSGLNDVARVRLKSQNIFWVGARDLDDGEIETMKRLNILDHVYGAALVHEWGCAKVLDDIRCKMNKRNIQSVHLSFDIDGMDPSIVTATGTKVPDGLMQSDLQDFVAALPTLPPIQTMDFVEYNPAMDDAEYTTGKWCIETLNQIYQKCV